MFPPAASPGMAPHPPTPPGGTGAAMAPGGMAGSAAQSLSSVKLALEALQKALPGLDAGSPLHTTVLKAVTDISKNLSKGADDQSGVMQQLVSMARGAQQQPQQAAMQKMFPPPPAAGAAPLGGPMAA